MKERGTHAVTGAFGFTGSYIARRLLKCGRDVITLTNTPPEAHPLREAIAAYPLIFDQPEALKRCLDGVSVLYNTYWIRFEYDSYTFEDAIRNSEILFRAAREAGVEKIVHISITNPTEDSELPYFRGKARVEHCLEACGIPYTILRPALLFGENSILINNIAWLLRRFPVFGLFGDGAYRLCPIHVDDLARMAVRHGSGEERSVIDGVGPEIFTFRELVQTIGAAIGVPRPLVPVPPWFGYFTARLLGHLTGDVLLTRDEIRGLMKNLLYVESPPTGGTRLSAWLQQHAESLGRNYESELARRK